MNSPEISQIQILPSQVVDQIAAGEVVERPAQMVKELVENSFDAGATQILVDFSDGGRSVRVTDNGRGIAKDELEKALDRFATSKIKTAEDLWRLRTFGFRGEALASISAVSELTLISRPAPQAEAAKLISKFGERQKFAAVSGDTGTTVVIEKLFENVPARLKFLKSASAESTQIKNVLKAMALSHPEVEMKILNQGELVFFWPKAFSRLERAKQVLEIEGLYEGTARREDVTAYSVFADPNTTAKTSKQMWFFAQDRWIQDRGLQAGVTEAYRHLLMHGEYPISVTWVETHPEKIDVNIHPTKSQVKFLDPSLAFRAVQASVRETLEMAPWLKDMKLEAPVRGADIRVAVENFSLQFADPALVQTQYKQKWNAPVASQLREPSESTFVAPSGVNWGSLQILGQAHLTYIIAQSREGLLLIDQHAAHERVLFEKLMKSWAEGGLDVQSFLFPMSIDLNGAQIEALLSEAKSFERLGLSLEQLGPTVVGVRAAPALVRESVLKAVLEKTAQEILDLGGSYSFERSVSDICATMACHSAVRAGQALSNEEMMALLRSMDEFPLSGFCPHGRPVQVEYTLSQMERDFGRVV
jgi:DNA mismatch repair protein MutL